MTTPSRSRCAAAVVAAACIGVIFFSVLDDLPGKLRRALMLLAHAFALVALAYTFFGARGVVHTPGKLPRGNPAMTSQSRTKE